MDINSLFSVFGITSHINTINGEICEVTNSNFDSKLVICHKSLTFGGRDNIPDELRVQIMYTNNNIAYDEFEKTGKAALLGIHDSEDIVCAWKLKFSRATQGTISKQIKTKYIEQAKQVGFVQAPPNRSGEFVCVFRKEFIYFYLRNSSWLHDNPVKDLNEHLTLEEGWDTPYDVNSNLILKEDDASYDVNNRIANGTNILLYGVPGSGKSWTIEHEYCEPGTHVERLVFHPDYTNADFIGQILPVVDEDKQVTYEFVAGPFTNILRDAYLNPQRKFVLIIEEINRGNAPAIFGDVFQLLDRTVEKKTVDGITYNVGTSGYGITNENIANCVYSNSTHKVYIPSNLSIFGTMNTSDQNVFTLDTAFQRRWKMRLIENNFDNVRESLANAQILDTGVSWKLFCTTINKIIVGNKSKVASAEDKRLGVYFVHENDLEYDSRDVSSEDNLLKEYNTLLKAEREKQITSEQSSRLSDVRVALKQNRVFPEKVIKYLWDDAFKFTPEAVFDTEKFDCLEDVIRAFIFSKGTARFNIFKQGLRDNLYPQQ
jgi:hypothetical protein